MVNFFIRSIVLCCIVSQASALYINVDGSSTTGTASASVSAPTTASSTAASTTTAEASQSTSVSPLGSPSDVFLEGGACKASWLPASTSASNWKSMTIDLMTGSNLQMTKLGTVATDIDGTNPSTTTFNYSCPQVSPNAAIYFLQYTDNEGNNPTWTTRFAIANVQGQTVAPPNANQPQGGSPPIPWGEGALVINNTSTTTTSSTSSQSSMPTALPTNTNGSLQSQLALAYSSILNSQGSQSEYSSMNAARSSNSVKGSIICVSVVFAITVSFVF